MSNRSRNPAMLGTEKPQGLDGFGVSDDAGNGFSAGSIGRLTLGAGLSHSGRTGLQSCSAVRLSSSRDQPDPTRSQGDRPVQYAGRWCAGGGTVGSSFLRLPVEPIPTMGESYIVTSYNSTTVRREAML